MRIDELNIDSEFESMIPPLTDEEQRTLAETILEDGRIYFPLIVWNNTIIDGHNRYRILREHPTLIYEVREKDFADRDEAKAWICKNQLGRRNLIAEQKKYLIGKQYEAEKQRQGTNNQYVQAKNEKCQLGTFQNRSDTAERIAQENGIGRRSVYRAESFAKAVDAAEKVSPGIAQEILSGKIHPSDQDVIALNKVPPEQRAEKVEQLRIPRERTVPGKRRRKEYEDIDRIYEELKAPKRVTEDSALESLQSVVRNMMETSDVLFEHFPGLLSIQTYREKVIEIMQKPKEYIRNLEEFR